MVDDVVGNMESLPTLRAPGKASRRVVLKRFGLEELVVLAGSCNLLSQP